MAAREGERHVVTGAFGFTGRRIAARLLEAGVEVTTLTSRPESESPFGGRVRAAPFDFDRPDRLVETLRGAAVLYNTYWVRYAHSGATYERAVENSRALLGAACRAGVRRVVHVSIANPSLDSPLPYYRGKAMLERDLGSSGLSHAILRPTVIFGPGDILINNIAWFVRRFPVFAVPGDGAYGVRPIFVEDMADLAVREGAGTEDTVLDAIGPETYRFDDLVALIARSLDRRVRLLHVPPGLALALTRAAGWWVGDVVLTREEIAGLMQGLLVSREEPTGATRLSAWLAENRRSVGVGYASEVARHFRGA